MGTENTDATGNAGATSANDLGGSDDLLSPMEATDPDELGAEEDEVPDPPQTWSAADKFGMSAEEQRAGETLDDRLAAEEPDISEN
ncbi:hypothetical protein [Mycolicibacterium neoaurum]|uniref:hypothetical protein n=1 Tax=Mycolicibacterium neoaurum TaxID=1795 RepID=UPI001F4D0090|nr:hypothetical protein [Mycolicibacterium neoaurum]